MSRMRRTHMTWVILAVVFAIAFSGLTTLAADKAAKQQVIRYNLGTDPETLDPAMSTGVPEATVETNLFEGLTRLDKNLIPQPAIATSWDISKDGKVYTFHLRDSKWSNGQPLTAHDFEYAWKRALNPETAAEYAYQLYYIKNGEAYNTGKIKDANQVGVKALDDRTLQVTLEAPASYFLSLCAFPTLMPVYRKAVEANPTSWFTKPETSVVNGPFKLEKWTRGDRVILVKNPNYYDAKNVKLSRIEMTLVDDNNTELTMYETNQIDIGDNPPPQDLPNLIKRGVVKIGPQVGTYFFDFNVNKAPFNDKRVRKALAMAIDRKAIVEKVTKGGQIPAYSWVPPMIPDQKAGTEFRKVGGDLFKEDVAAAKKLLAEAGYPDGKGFPTIEITYNTNEGHKAVAEAIQEMWKKNLGINVTITNQEWKVFLNTRDEGNYMVARDGWLGDYIHPMTMMDLQVTNGGNNDTGYSNPAYDKLIDTAKNTNDAKVQYKAMHDAEKILMDDMPVMPIYFYTDQYMLKSYVKDVIFSPLGMRDFKYAWVAAH